MFLNTKLKKVRVLQYTAALVASLTALSNSTHTAWTSPTLPLLRSDDSPIGVTITSSEASWIVSIRNLGSIAGCLLAIWTNDYLGRRITLIMSTVPFFASWVIIFFAKSVLALYIARFIVGLGSGLMCTTLPIYNAEIAEKDIRGRLSNLFVALGLLGSLYIYTVGPFVSYHVLAGTCGIVPFAVMIMCWFLPETPYYLAKKDKMDKARKCIVKLSNNQADENFIEERMQEIRSTLKNDSERTSQFWELFTKSQFRKPFIIVTGLKTVQHFSGIQPISAYMQTIIESSGSNLSSSYSSIIFGFAQFVSSLISGQIVDKIGRKPLLLISAVSCSLALFGEGSYFYILEAINGNTDPISWLPLTGLVMYQVMITIGISTLPYVIVGELFTMNIKGYAVSFNTIYGAALGFTMNSLYVPISDNWGTYTMFWIYGSTCILGSIFIYIFLPETKDKTFDEIQKKLDKK